MTGWFRSHLLFKCIHCEWFWKKSKVSPCGTIVGRLRSDLGKWANKPPLATSPVWMDSFVLSAWWAGPSPKLESRTFSKAGELPPKKMFKNQDTAPRHFFSSFCLKDTASAVFGWVHIKSSGSTCGFLWCFVIILCVSEVKWLLVLAETEANTSN